MKRIIAFMVALLFLASLMTYTLTLDREKTTGWQTIRIEVIECPEDEYCTWVPMADWNCTEWRDSNYTNSNNETINIEWQMCWYVYEAEP